MARVKPKLPKRTIKPKVRKVMEAKTSVPQRANKRSGAGEKTKKILQLKSKEEKIVGIFTSRGKKPPVRYRRPTPKGMVKVVFSMQREIKPGEIIEFKYGNKQKPGQVGGWKNDPRPVLLVFYDDGVKYVEGINTNYLSGYYIRKLHQIMKRFPGIDGIQMYAIISQTAKFAVTKGYRKYMRESFRNAYLYKYENEFVQDLSDKAKKESEKGTVIKNAR